MKSTRCLDGAQGSWKEWPVDEAEGRGSAAGTPQAFVYFLFFWMVEDVVCCKHYCEKINWYFLRNEERSDECRGK